MKVFSLLLVCAAVAALLPANAQSRRSRATRPASAATSAAAEVVESKTGVRFVICSPADIELPSPLYARVGKVYAPVRIGARRPSMRLKPVNGKIDFWDKNPNPAADLEALTPGAKKATKLPEPLLSVKVPSGTDDKAICILAPNKDPKKTKALFLNEKDFPRGGMHIINLSSFPLVISTWEKDDMSDIKNDKVGFYRQENGICPDNSWTFKGKKGQQVNLVASYVEKGAKKPRRFKATAFSISSKSSNINLVVKDPAQNRPKIISFQAGEDKESAE